MAQISFSAGEWIGIGIPIVLIIIGLIIAPTVRPYLIGILCLFLGILSIPILFCGFPGMRDLHKILITGGLLLLSFILFGGLFGGGNGGDGDSSDKILEKIKKLIKK
ncbi:MAG: hypothetical protein WC302_02820 [Candidatus Paceibacterota bacterium]|jgi:hypothetical protein